MGPKNRQETLVTCGSGIRSARIYALNLERDWQICILTLPRPSWRLLSTHGRTLSSTTSARIRHSNVCDRCRSGEKLTWDIPDAKTTLSVDHAIGAESTKTRLSTLGKAPSDFRSEPAQLHERSHQLYQK